jgi:hypothetical protein
MKKIKEHFESVWLDSNWAKHDDFDLAYAYFANLHKQMGALIHYNECAKHVQMKKPSLHDLLCIAITRHKAIDLKKL